MVLKAYKLQKKKFIKLVGILSKNVILETALVYLLKVIILSLVPGTWVVSSTQLSVYFFIVGLKITFEKPGEKVVDFYLCTGCYYHLRFFIFSRQNRQIGFIRI